MITIYLLYFLAVFLFILVGLADLTGHFGAAQKIANINFFVLLFTFLLRLLKKDKNEK